MFAREAVGPPPPLFLPRPGMSQMSWAASLAKPRFHGMRGGGTSLHSHAKKRGGGEAPSLSRPSFLANFCEKGKATR